MSFSPISYQPNGISDEESNLSFRQKARANFNDIAAVLQQMQASLSTALTVIQNSIPASNPPFTAWSPQAYPINFPVSRGNLFYITNQATSTDPAVPGNSTVYTGANVSTPWTSYANVSTAFKAWMDRIYGQV